jgi:hypothetical protein
MKVSVKTITGKVEYFEVEDSVLQLKEKISEVEECQMDSLRLIYGGKMLEDDNTLSHYEITDGTCVHLQLSIRGGMFHPTSARADYSTLKASALKLDIQRIEDILKRIK